MNNNIDKILADLDKLVNAKAENVVKELQQDISDEIKKVGETIKKNIDLINEEKDENKK